MCKLILAQVFDNQVTITDIESNCLKLLLSKLLYFQKSAISGHTEQSHLKPRTTPSGSKGSPQKYIKC